jgi:spore germination cell wall hydrolase CwlJ-like protein
MARLTIEQVKAPDFSAASDILAASGRSFNAGMDSASSLLEKYQAGQTSKDDAAIAAELAKISSEEEFNAYIEKNPFAGRNASDDMISTVLGTRKDTLGYAQDRAVTEGQYATTDNTRASAAGTRSRTAIGQAQEGRDVYNFNDTNKTNAQLRQAGPLAVAAYTEGQRNGNEGGGGAAPSSSMRDMLAKTVYAEAGNQGFDGMMATGAVIRNRADTGKFGDGIEGVIMKPGQFSAWNSVTGYAGGEQGQDMTNMVVPEEAYRVADALIAGDYKDPTNGATHYYNKSISQPKWGNQGNWTQIGDHSFGNPDGVRASASGPVVGSNRPGPVTQNPNANVGPQGQAFQEALASGQFDNLDPTQLFALLAQAERGQAAGQTAIDGANDEADAEYQAQVLLDLQNSVDVLTPRDARIATQDVEGRDAAETLALRQAATDSFGEGGAGAARVADITGISDADRSTAELAIADSLEAQRRDPTVQAFEGSRSFESAPAESLRSALQGLDADATIPPDIEGKIDRLAKKMDVSPGEAAYAYAKGAETAWNNAPLVGADGILSFMGDGLNQAGAEDYIETYFKGDKSAQTRTRLADDTVKSRELERLVTSVDTAQKIVNRNIERFGEATPTQLRDLERKQAALAQAND